MRLHREGTNTLLLSTALFCIVGYVLLHFKPFPVPLLYTLLAVLGVIFLIIVAFFRVPTRMLVAEPDTIKSPCDGKVVAIERVHEPEYFNEERLQVSIFMSPLNVHINYHPISGITNYYKYHPGKYLVAWHPKSSTENERSTVVVENPNGSEVLMRQIAGALARRICTYPRPGEPAEQGKEFGFIKFGSRVDLFLPLDSKLQVELDQKVIGSQTVIATYSEQK